jgi:hypothetical protein
VSLWREEREGGSVRRYGRLLLFREEADASSKKFLRKTMVFEKKLIPKDYPKGD